MRDPAPWDRRSAESEQAYIGFLFYRNLGPSRSLKRAYSLYVVETDLATKGNAEDVPVPGQWTQFSAQFEWVHRSREWDIWRLQTYGSRAAVLYTYNLERALERHAEALDRFEISDDEWEMILKTFDSLGDQLVMVREGIKRSRLPIGPENADSRLRICGDVSTRPTQGTLSRDSTN